MIFCFGLGVWDVAVGVDCRFIECGSIVNAGIDCGGTSNLF